MTIIVISVRCYTVLSTAVSPGKVDQYKARISAQEACLIQSEVVVSTLVTQNSKMWSFFDSIKVSIFTNTF